MQSLATLFSRSGIVWYVLIVVVVPVATLAIGGIVYFWNAGLFLPILLLWAAITVSAYLVYIRWPPFLFNFTRKQQKSEIPGDAPTNRASELPHLEPRSDWTDKDRAVWEALQPSIDTHLAGKPDWAAIPQIVLALLPEVAQAYHPKSRQSLLNFTLPEALLVIAIVSDRYRRVIKHQIPYSEKITLAQLVFIYQNQPKIRKGFGYANNVKRFLRLSNPLSAALGELREHFTNRVFENISESVGTGLKRLLLQEVSQVAIDLYSGRLKVSDDELAEYRSKVSQLDENRMAVPVEPLRVVLLGQISAGKSSLVNALADELTAEVDQLPTTDQTTVYALSSTELDTMHLVDTQGATQEHDHIAELVESAADADLVLWVVKANQPARAADQLLLDAFKARFSADPSRRAPPIVLVVTHVDQLTPRSEWQPPYDLQSDSKKARNMLAAISSIITTVGFDPETPAIPVCLDASKCAYNTDAVSIQLQALGADAAQTQLNRRRVEFADQSPQWRDRWSQLKGLGRLVGNLKDSL